MLTHPLTLTLIAFVMTAIPAFLLTKIIGKHLESMHIMAWSLIIGGIVMWIVDAIYERSQHKAFARGRLTTDMEQMSLGQAVWIGLCHAVGGLSRHLALDVDDHRRRIGRNGSSDGAGVFVLSFDPDDGVATVYDLFKSMRPHHGEPSAIGAMPSDAHSWIGGRLIPSRIDLFRFEKPVTVANRIQYVLQHATHPHVVPGNRPAEWFRKLQISGFIARCQENFCGRGWGALRAVQKHF